MKIRRSNAPIEIDSFGSVSWRTGNEVRDKFVQSNTSINLDYPRSHMMDGFIIERHLDPDKAAPC